MSVSDAEHFMTEGIEGVFDVTGWPRWMRRSFIMTLPASAPLYVCAFFAAILFSIAWYLAAVIVSAWE